MLPALKPSAKRSASYRPNPPCSASPRSLLQRGTRDMTRRRTLRWPQSSSDSLTEPMGWVPWLLRSGLYFDRSNLGSDQGRARALFADLAGDADLRGPHFCDVPTWMAEDLAPLTEQLGYGYGMGAFSK